MSARYRYEIDKNNAISIWDAENPNDKDAPFMFQPDWPDTTPWANKTEAEAWAKAFIAELEDPTSEFLAGDSPKQPLKPRPIVEDSAAETPVE